MQEIYYYFLTKRKARLFIHYFSKCSWRSEAHVVKQSDECIVFLGKKKLKIYWWRSYYIQDRAFRLFKIIFLRHSWDLNECSFGLLQRNALNLEKTFLHVQTPPLSADCSDSWALSHVWNGGENITFLFSAPLFHFCAHVAFFPWCQCWDSVPAISDHVLRFICP